MIASLEGHSKVVKLLLETGACFDLQRNNGQSCLSIACKNGNYLIAKILLDYGAQPNLLCKNGISSLHYAIMTGDVELIKLLLARGAHIQSGPDVLTMAIDNGAQPEIIELLIQASESDVTGILFKALERSVSFQDHTHIQFLFQKCLSKIVERFPLTCKLI